jgi:N6-adenosine-specific RNA methylase IME4
LPEDGNKVATKAERRAQRELELASKQAELPSQRYGVIVADPEWRFEPYSRETGMDRAADNHYPTSITDIIAQRDIASIAADDCVLFLWATVPMLEDAMDVLKAWGFKYKSHAIWDKVHIGTGYWFRNRHELLLVGTKGDIPAPAMGDQFASVMTIARKEHSAKPEQFLELIEQYFPNLPKIELNRRGPARPGWDAWGNEAEVAAE